MDMRILLRTIRLVVNQSTIPMDRWIAEAITGVASYQLRFAVTLIIIVMDYYS